MFLTTKAANQTKTKQTKFPKGYKETSGGNRHISYLDYGDSVRAVCKVLPYPIVTIKYR